MNRSNHYATVLFAAMLSPAMLQITECGNGPTGNTLLTSLELEAGGQNRIVGFVSAKRIYEIWVRRASTPSPWARSRSIPDPP